MAHPNSLCIFRQTVLKPFPVGRAMKTLETQEEQSNFKLIA